MVDDRACRAMAVKEQIMEPGGEQFQKFVQVLFEFGCGFCEFAQSLDRGRGVWLKPQQQVDNLPAQAKQVFVQQEVFPGFRSCIALKQPEGWKIVRFSECKWLAASLCC